MEKLKLDERAKQIMYKAAYVGFAAMMAVGSIALAVYLIFKPEAEIFLAFMIVVPLMAGSLTMMYAAMKNGYFDWQRDEINRNPEVKQRSTRMLIYEFFTIVTVMFVMDFFILKTADDPVGSIVKAVLTAVLYTLLSYWLSHRRLKQEASKQ